MKKSRGVLILALTVIVTALLIFTSAVGWGPTGTGAAKNIHTGLDLAGGVSITYEASEKIQAQKICRIPSTNSRRE